MNPAVNNMNSLLDKNRLTKDDVSMFCLTQIAYKNIELFREKLEINEDKSYYVGRKYGYTGTSSPFLVLYEGIKSGQIKRGSYVMFFTVAGGGMYITELIKY